jgi:hypothetical protein
MTPPVSNFRLPYHGAAQTAKYFAHGRLAEFSLSVSAIGAVKLNGVGPTLLVRRDQKRQEANARLSQTGPIR